jgi:hypothetical protein
MLKYCIEKWEQNKNILKDALSKDDNLNTCDYEYLVRMVVRYILNKNIREDDVQFNESDIAVIDHGNYQGSQLFVVAEDTYQPGYWQYLIGYQHYGSCSGCDTLKSIRFDIRHDAVPFEAQLKEYMSLCKDIVCSFVRPFRAPCWDDDDSMWIECEVEG